MLPSNKNNYYFNENNFISNLFSSSSSSLSYFPSSPFNHYDDYDFFLQNLPQINTTTTTTKETELDEMTNKINDSINNSVVVSMKKNVNPPKKRSSKKDRHSKINTAKGPRDRRMRLSLDIAKEFFGLQDMLGFDKASTTVEWLLTKAKHDIKKLGASASLSDRLIHTIDSGSVVFGAKSASSTSECEVISGVIDLHEKPSTTIKEKTKHKEVRKPVSRTIRTKELREKAREKARERTKIKMCSKTNQALVEESNQVGSSWSPSLSLEVAQMVEVQRPISAQEGEYIVDNDDDHSLVMMDKWSPISFFSHLQDNIDEENEFEDFQFYSKPWESYNIQSLL